MKLTVEQFVEKLTPAERSRAERVESVLPALRASASEADREGSFYLPNVEVLRDAGLLGLVVPEEYGGLGGGLRDLAGAAYAMGTACPSTAMAYFFHCSAVSRGLLALETIERGLFTPEEIPTVRAFAEKVLRRMGAEGQFFANFASESAKSASAAVTIQSTAVPVEGGYLLTGVKSFGCNTGVADVYLVAARMEGIDTAKGIALFHVDPNAKGVAQRAQWDAIGMRASATHGITMDKVFVPAEEALVIPAAYTRMMECSRGSFVGNQLAGPAIYLGVATSAYEFALEQLTTRTLQDTGRPIAENPYHLELIGKMAVDLETAGLWLRRQLELESCAEPLLPKDRVVQQWRMCKGEVCDAAFRVATHALKACGTSATGMSAPIPRAIRELTMGLVQGFPSERGRLEAARMVVTGTEQSLFGAQQ